MGHSKGSGGKGRRQLEGRGPTPPAELRPGHPAQRRSRSAARRATTRAVPRRPRRPATADLVVGRNAVVEALRAGVPSTALYVAAGLARDDRVDESRALAAEAGASLLEVSRPELDRLSGGAAHQGVGLAVKPYDYAHPGDLLRRLQEAAAPPLVVALDGVTDPHNLGAIARSAAAFGAGGLIVPERRSVGVTPAAWRASAGTLARLPVAAATNLVRTLKDYAAAGLMLVGLDGRGELDLSDLELATAPLVLVVGAEGRGLSRLVAETCDLSVRIPLADQVESLNASVAAGIALAEIARRRAASA